MTSLSPTQRTLRARVAAFAMHAKGRTNTVAATKAQLARFERQVDPDGLLTEAERARRADFAMRGYMTNLSLKASRARSRRSPEAAATKEATTVLETPVVAQAEVRRASVERSAS